MSRKLFAIFGLFTLAAILLPASVLAQQQSAACGEASTTFEYPSKIIFNQANGYLYTFSETGLLTVLKESDLSVVKKFQAAKGFAKDFALNSKTGLLFILDNKPAKIRVYDATTSEAKWTLDISEAKPTELFQINVDEAANKLYVLDRTGSRFIVIDLNKKGVIEEGFIKEYKISYASAFWTNFKAQKAYFRSQGINGIQELDLKTGKLTDIPTGPLPQDLAIDTVNNRVLVVDSQARNLVAIDAATRKIFKTIDLKLIGAPRFVAVSEKLNMAVATCYTNNAAFYNLKTLDLLKHVVLPENSQPERTFFDEEGKLAYIPNFLSNVISVIDLNNFSTVSNVPTGILHDPIYFRHNFLMKEGLVTSSGNFYLTYPYSHNISRLTPEGKMTFVGGFSKDDPLLNHCPADKPIFAYPVFMDFNQDQSKFYVANRGRFVTVIDAAKDEPVRKIDLSGAATYVKYNDKLDRIFVSRMADNKISIIDAKKDKIIGEIETGVRPRQIISNTTNGDTYVLTALGNAITVIHPDLSTSEIKLDSEPLNGKYDASTDKLFISTFNSAFVVDGKDNKILKTLPELRNSNVFNAGNKIVFNNSFANYFTVVDPASLEIKKVDFANPFYIAYYELAKKVYVIDLYDTKIGVFDAEFKPLGMIDSFNIAKNFGTTFLAASDKYIYRMDDPNSIVQIIDPATDKVIGNFPLVSGRYVSGSSVTPPISAFLVDKKSEKLYLSNAPLPQVMVFYFADINKFASKIIGGSFEMPLFELLLRYWWVGLIALAVVAFSVYYFLFRKKENELV